MKESLVQLVENYCDVANYERMCVYESTAAQLRNMLLRLRVSIEINDRMPIYYGFYLKQCGIFKK